MNQTVRRKLEHIDICLNKDVQSGVGNGFEEVDILSDRESIDPEKVNLETSFLGKKFRAPIFIEAMTGGAPGTEKINKNLAMAAQELGLGMGVGSQRAALENPRLAYTYKVRDCAPDIFLLGNIGIAQLKEYSLEDLTSLVEMIDADGLAVHFNLQHEKSQPEGDEEFHGIYESFESLCRNVDLSLIHI